MLADQIHLLSGDVMITDIAAKKSVWTQDAADVKISRDSNQLFCMISGTRDYFDTNGQKLYTVTAGDVLFMPVGSSYRTIVTSPEGNVGIGILFSIFDRKRTELILDDSVRLVARDENQYYSKTMYKLLDYVLQGGFANLKAKELLYNLLYSLSTDQTLMQENPRLKSIMPAIRYMEDNLQATLSIDMLAEMCFMSKSTFHRRFLSEFSVSPTVYHLKMRLQKSQNLLESGMYSVEQVADLMGFCDTGYFSRMFKKYTGEYAGECRRSQKKNTVG